MTKHNCKKTDFKHHLLQPIMKKKFPQTHAVLSDLLHLLNDWKYILKKD